MFKLEGMGMETVDELKRKSVELGLDWIECMVKKLGIEDCSWFLASALGRRNICSPSGRRQMKEQWRESQELHSASVWQVAPIMMKKC